MVVDRIKKRRESIKESIKIFVINKEVRRMYFTTALPKIIVKADGKEGIIFGCILWNIESGLSFWLVRTEDSEENMSVMIDVEDEQFSASDLKILDEYLKDIIKGTYKNNLSHIRSELLLKVSDIINLKLFPENDFEWRLEFTQRFKLFNHFSTIDDSIGGFSKDNDSIYLQCYKPYSSVYDDYDYIMTISSLSVENLADLLEWLISTKARSN